MTSPCDVPPKKEDDKEKKINYKLSDVIRDLKNTLRHLEGNVEELVDVQEIVSPGSKDKYTPYYPSYSRFSNENLQLSHMTSEERFPLIFDNVKRLCPNAKRILSFGCSTGQECKALRKRFPNSEIVGVDIDNASIQTARKENNHHNTFFQNSLEATGTYDLCLALMVFFGLEKPIDYNPFKKALGTIHRHLNPGGVLVIYTSDYNPISVPEIAQYKQLHIWKRIHNKNKKEYYNGYYAKRSLDDLKFLKLGV